MKRYVWNGMTEEFKPFVIIVTAASEKESLIKLQEDYPELVRYMSLGQPIAVLAEKVDE